MDTTTVAHTADGEVRRFKSRKPPIKFYVDDDLFEAVGNVPAELMKEIIENSEAAAKKEGIQAQYDSIMFTVERVLTKQSLEYFRQRLGDKENPISFTILGEVTQWLVADCYSNRPTQSLSPSTELAMSDGSSSTDGAQAAESILSAGASAGTDTST